MINPLPVHPRWRGEHISIWKAVASHVRFIPAGAGNTQSSGGETAGTAVHPRWRGEHQLNVAKDKVGTGSSPLARGTQAQDLFLITQHRFIPAGAGNTHPAGATSRPLAGSSPLARGTPPPRLSARHPARFIPAGAGNTTSETPVTSTWSVHPRWRGEHTAVEAGQRDVAGSSPLARGTQAAPAARLLRVRFIPAGAGNTYRSMVCRLGGPVHPRWRGEHRARRPGHNRIGRFIPAGAGNTRQGVAERDDIHGSSPLARGTLVDVTWSRDIDRFIPAGAGNTCCAHPLHLRRHGSSPLARGTLTIMTLRL